MSDQSKAKIIKNLKSDNRELQENAGVKSILWSVIIIFALLLLVPLVAAIKCLI